MTTFKLLENVGWHVPRLKWWCLLPAVDLASVLTPEIMAPILANTEVQQRLMPYLPSGESLPQSTEELHNTLSSPQFQQVEFAEGLRSSDFCVFLIWKAVIVFRDIYINQQSLNSSLRLSYLLPVWAAPGGSSDKHTNHSWLLFPAGVWPSAVSRPWSTEIACNTRYCILVVVRLSNLVVVFVIILGICCLSAGYEHVQQRSGVRAVRTSNEPVWLARGGCGCG